LNLDCNILHLEDDDNDSLFFQRALDQFQFRGAYRRVSSVQETLDYLAGRGEFSDRHLYPMPGVLVADSSLGALTGPQTSDLMTWLDAREEFGSLVRVMLTGGMSAGEQEKWLHRGIACVLLKGVSHEDIAAAVREILRRC
jgi:hypothetical protein